MSEQAKSESLKPSPSENRYSVTQLSHGKTDEILGKVAHGRAVVTIIRFGKPVARIVPIDAKITMPGERPLTDPTAKIAPTSPTTKD